MSLRGLFTRWAVGSTAIIGVSIVFQSLAGPASVPAALGDVAPYPGMQGTDTALPLTDSAVIYEETRDSPFKGYTISVSQTENLSNQAISITWDGAAPTQRGNGAFDGNFLQIMQCWGDPVEAADGTFGPPPEQCEFGALGGSYGGVSRSSYPGYFTTQRNLGDPTWTANEGSDGVVADGGLWRSFRAVGGAVIDAQVDASYLPDKVGGYWLNPYFDQITTNELVAARTFEDGHGEAIFAVETGVQSAGLGCGQRVQPVDATTKKVPRCWLVVVPRGTPEYENAGTPMTANSAEWGVATSPLSTSAWANRVAIELTFNPVDSPCDIRANDRRLVGTDLLVSAVSSWQPVLCTIPGLPPYSFAPVADSLARQQVINPVAGGPGLVVVPSPVAPEAVDPESPLVYAPLALSGVVIGFNVERQAQPSAPEVDPIAGTRVADINLTPRLVAKLLTQSYSAQVKIEPWPDYPWISTNPFDLSRDPDFVHFNPEFGLLAVDSSRTFGGLQLPQGNSDAAKLVWQWIFADPEARAWLGGEPDPWGMTVNPYYSTNPEINPSGVPFLSPDHFPKSEPYCFQAPTRANGVVPIPLCATDWMPYSRNFGDSARITRAASDGARIAPNQYPQSSALSWNRINPQVIGHRAVLSITDTPSAVRLNVQMARLSRAGDNGPDRQFVAPGTAGLTSGLAAMQPSATEGVLATDPSAQAPGAYPLTVLSYGVLAPLSLDEAARSDYAAFIRYAVADGQVPGAELGLLPPGYVPLSDSLRTQALAAADAVKQLQPTPTTTTTTTTTTVPSTTTPTTVATEDVQQPSSGSQTRGGGGGGGGGSSRSSNITTAPTSPVPLTTVPTSVPDSVPPTTTRPTESSAAPPVVEVEAPQPPSQPSSVATPVLAISQSRMAVPALGSIALAAGLGALEITKRPRRVRSGAGSAAGAGGGS